MARQIQSKWQTEGFSLKEALMWARIGVTTPEEARLRMSQGDYPPGYEKEKKPHIPKAKTAEIKGAFVLLRVTQVLDFKPLSEGLYRSPRAAARAGEIAHLMELLDCSQISVVAAFAMYLAELLRQKVKHCVKTQMIAGVPMKTVYKELSEQWKKRKNPRHKDDFWVNTEFLIRSLRIWRKGSDIYMGHPPTVLHPESKKAGQRVSAAHIMLWLERGTNDGIPARPLFTPIVKSISRNIDGYWRHFYDGVKARKPEFVHFVRKVL